MSARSRCVCDPIVWVVAVTWTMGLVTGSSQAAEPKPVKSGEPLEHRLDVNYQDAPMASVLDDLRRRAGLNSAYARYIDKTFKFTLKGKNLRVREVLEKLACAGQLDLDCADGLALFWRKSDLKLKQRMKRRIAFEFVDTPLSEVFRYLGAATKLNFVLDPREDAGECPINLKISNMRTELALNWILKLAELEYTLCNGKVYVGAAEGLESLVELEELKTRHGKKTMPETPRPDDDTFHKLWISLENPRTRRNAVYRLAVMKDDRARGLLEIALTYEHPPTRRQVLEIMTFRDGARALPWLKWALEDPDKGVRLTAIHALEKIGGEQALLLVKKALANSDIRADGLRILGKLGHRKALPILEAALDDPDEEVRRGAILGLGHVGGKRVLALLEKAMADKSVGLRNAAINAVDAIGGGEVLPLLKKALRDKDEWNRMYAGIVLANNSSSEALKLLEEVIDDIPPGGDGNNELLIKTTGLHGLRTLRFLSRALKREEVAREDPDWKREIRRQLQQKVSLEFAATPLKQSISMFQTLTQTPLVLDPRTLEGDAANPPITIRIRDEPLASALKKALDQVKLDFALVNQAVWISTPEQIKDRVEFSNRPRVRTWAARALREFRGNYVRDLLIERALGEPNNALRSTIVETLRSDYGNDPGVKQVLGKLRAQPGRPAKSPPQQESAATDDD